MKEKQEKMKEKLLHDFKKMKRKEEKHLQTATQNQREESREDYGETSKSQPAKTTIPEKATKQQLVAYSCLLTQLKIQ
jgi:hypothetical protein